MEVKQKQFFHGHIITMWGLEKVEKELREAAEFVNLYSKWRGSNRFPALLRTFDLLAERPEVRQSGAALPDTRALRAYVESDLPLGNPSLKEEVQRTADPELQRVLDWSLAVNADIAANMAEIPPFSGVTACLEKIDPHSDSIVVSQTPEEALVHEWELHGLSKFVELIAGQELGTKSEHLQMAAGGKYPPEKILMIGDAPGDRKAAEAVGACFYPINPGAEEASWKRFLEEAYDVFLAGEFKGPYQEQLIAEFEALLPETPPWH
jgi:phosphoglycolate phosphatase-like HAD superfamily hydrolase